MAGRMLGTYPRDSSSAGDAEWAACIDACLECAQVCTACADACLTEDSVEKLTACIRTDLDCADLCGATVRILSRRTDLDVAVTRLVLEACAAACDACAVECDRHASMHEHCAVCAEVCRRCEKACRDLIAALA